MHPPPPTSGRTSSDGAAPGTSTFSSDAGSIGGRADTDLDEAGSAGVLRAELSSLRSELARERRRRETAEAQVVSLRRESTLTQVKVEEEEEAISNRLMKRLSALKLEKEQIARASESDSEWVANSLTARLEDLRRQKHDVIAAAEAENEFIVNRLNKELEALRLEKLELERKVEQLSRSTTPAGGTPGSSPAHSLSSGSGFSRASSYRLPAPATGAGAGAGAAGAGDDDRGRIAPMPHSPYSGGAGAPFGH